MSYGLQTVVLFEMRPCHRVAFTAREHERDIARVSINHDDLPSRLSTESVTLSALRYFHLILIGGSVKGLNVLKMRHSTHRGCCAGHFNNTIGAGLYGRDSRYFIAAFIPSTCVNLSVVILVYSVVALDSSVWCAIVRPKP
jgi:hypothetical protein